MREVEQGTPAADRLAVGRHRRPHERCAMATEGEVRGCAVKNHGRLQQLPAREPGELPATPAAAIRWGDAEG